jgi:hypothetical protein
VQALEAVVRDVPPGEYALGAGAERLGDVVRRQDRPEHDAPYAVSAIPEPAGHVDPIDEGQPDLDEHDVRIQLGNERHGMPAVARDVDDQHVAVGVEDGAKLQAPVFVRIGQHDLDFVHGFPPPGHYERPVKGPSIRPRPRQWPQCFPDRRMS